MPQRVPSAVHRHGAVGAVGHFPPGPLLFVGVSPASIWWSAPKDSRSNRTHSRADGRRSDAIQRIGGVLPELGAHLSRSVLTGTACRYEPDEHLTWTVRPGVDLRAVR